ncbi:hypothetical protein [Planococcus sp. ISL-109]|uniref:hypothetical protein n=1 Tax=Planococcus sp. ISL-109 TaxID=2819166 RepID=UPI001BEA3A55|nr:hypothetical protein [Planococcus sp. ISL-109]MBT2584212.1 hypothetical protein [Planococcus sp. ISL-109]
MVQYHLKGPILVAVKVAFKKVEVTFTRKSLEKSIPFDLGVVVGTSSNRVLTLYVGKKAKDFFKTREFEVDEDDSVPA